MLALLQGAQGFVLMAVAAGLGLLIAHQIGLGVPLLEGLLAGKPVTAQAQAIIAPALILGIASSAVLLLLEITVFWPRLPQAMRTEFPIPALWKRLLASFYGGITRMVPNDPFPGYMPPPLDGVWATAPYLHNGSVPTVELLLNSKARPKSWRPVELDSTHFDEEALGWPFEVVADPAAVPEADRKLVYDATFWSQSNAGHTFGDHLTAEERRAVIEYLKTL